MRGWGPVHSTHSTHSFDGQKKRVWQKKIPFSRLFVLNEKTHFDWQKNVKQSNVSDSFCSAISSAYLLKNPLDMTIFDAETNHSFINEGVQKEMSIIFIKGRSEDGTIRSAESKVAMLQKARLGGFFIILSFSGQKIKDMVRHGKFSP